MGPIQDEENRNDINSRKSNSNWADLSDFATQQIDSQFSPAADDYLLDDAFETQWNLAGETQVMDFADETQVVDFADETRVVDFADETQVVDFAGETQAVDLADETQVVDLAGETQVVDFVGETQVLDDLDCMKNKPIEFLNEFNAEVGFISKSEGTNETDSLCETQELSEDDSLKIDGCDSVGPKSTMDSYHSKQGDNASGAPSDTHSNKHSSGSVFRGFTSLRAASIRASGLLARAKGANNSNLCTTSSGKSSVEQQTYEQDGKNDQECLPKESSKKCKVGRTAVRQLFKEDDKDDADMDQSEPDINHTDDNLDMPEFLSSGNCLAGLSYVNSEEPGELSQANALEVVDRFLDLNVMECEVGNQTKIQKVEKPKVVSAAKGSRELAKSSNLKSSDEKCGTYDWDDTREDEGGGDFFQKKKDVFFDTKQKKCLTEPRKKPKNVDFPNVKDVGNNGEKKLGDSVYYSGSGLISHKPRAKGKSLNSGEGILHKNLIPDLEEVENIGPDTQMAAEAMENLCFEVQLPDSNGNCPSKGKANKKNQLSNKIDNSEKSRSTEIPKPANIGCVTRQAKRLKKASTDDNNNEVSLSKKQSKKASQGSEKQHPTRKSNRLKADGNSFDAKEEINDVISGPVLRKKRTPAKDRKAEMVKKVGSKKKYSVIAGTSDAEMISDKGTGINGGIETSPGEKCVTPVNRATPINNVSPICMGDEYHRQTCRKNLSRDRFSLVNEINRLVTSCPGTYVGKRDSRKRKDITNVRVLFSQHLDDDVVNKQKKILARLGGGVVSFMSDATHFVADEFVRTRNMLEAIACGKPVVTQLWLESCGQASCLIDEKNYILRDAKKEREFGFCLPVSLARACQHPLLQGQKVLVTPNTKPGIEILTNLVKAVHGLAVERLGRSILKDEKLPDDLLILSCEEDYDICVPFLEKGGVVYSSELLLNGIVKQKLEYERHRLFEDHVKRTRSTIWVKKKERYLPVTKCK